MIGIYKDNFIDFLKDYLGKDSVKVTSKNVVCRCPYCEMPTTLKKKHYHMHLSLEAPIFHCFFSMCHKKGLVNKLVKKISGNDISDEFIDKEKLKKIEKLEIVEKKKRKIILPLLKPEEFQSKTLYLKDRFKYTIDISNLKGLFFDINSFIDLNNIKLEPNIQNIRSYLHNNFIGFCTENQTIAIMRNIDKNSKFRHFKLSIQEEEKFSDYYKISGNNDLSNKIILGEGIFDIYLEHIFDSTGLRNDIKLYAAGLHTYYESLIKSIVFHEQIFKPEVYIISDRDVSLDYFKQVKKRINFLLDRLIIFYNKNGKDFADVPINLETFVI